MEDKTYIVTLYKHEDLEQFYNEMESNNFHLVMKRPMSRNTHYIMTEEQATVPAFFRGRVTTVKVSQSDIRTIAIGQLSELEKEIKRSMKKNSDTMSKMHLETAAIKINRILTGKSI